jgi:hypothetical protein
MGQYPKDLKIEQQLNVIDISGVSITCGLSEKWENFNGNLPEIVQKATDFIINFKLYAYNTGTSAYITRTLFILIENCLHKNILVNWFYDENEEDMEDAGLMYKQIVSQKLKDYKDFRTLTFNLQNYE